MKSFYASGFLYNLKSQQILLIKSQPQDDTNPYWSIIGGDSNEGEDCITTFKRLVSNLFDLDLKDKDIYPIYDYSHEILNKTNYVFYAEVKDPPEFASLKKNTLSWVTFDETLKMLFSAHNKQDVIVGERVINLKKRIDQNLQEAF